MEQGRYQLRANGREYEVEPGNVCYFHESEDLEWLGNEEDVTFISVGFLASALPPLAAEHRLLPADRELADGFRLLLKASADASVAGACRQYAALLDMIARLPFCRDSAAASADDRAALWRRVESACRERRQFRMSLDEMCGIAGCSRATLVRICREVTGTSPARYLQELRMEEARGLLAFSPMGIGQIAEFLRYTRVHEFSREFRSYFGQPPSSFR